MKRPSLLLPLLLTLAGCGGASGPFPSLAPRPIEKELGEPAVPPVRTPVADDPEVAAQAAAFLTQAQAGDRAFHAALPEATEAARRAGAVGSDRWIQAQQALSRAIAAQDRTTRALAELDRYANDRAHAKPLSDADLARLQAATAEAQRLADAQRADVARLQAQLRTP